MLEQQRQVADGVPLVQAIEAAHGKFEAAAEGIGATGMGTTIVALKLEGLSYQIAWVGDSRAYLWNGALKLLTKDHSIVQMLIDAGAIDERTRLPRTLPKRHPAQALGTGGADPERITVAKTVGTLAQGDCLLLCSDGLTGELSPQAMSEILATSDDNQDPGRPTDRRSKALRRPRQHHGHCGFTVALPPEAEGRRSGSARQRTDDLHFAVTLRRQAATGRQTIHRSPVIPTWRKTPDTCPPLRFASPTGQSCGLS
ncbi:MAG: hypothetical protein U1E83_04540 [Methylotetracoccus sp.]